MSRSGPSRKRWTSPAPSMALPGTLLPLSGCRDRPPGMPPTSTTGNSKDDDSREQTHKFIRPRLTAVVNVIKGAPMPSYLSLMILYLPLAGNVGNEGAGGSASPPPAGHLLRLTCPTSPSSKAPRQKRVINLVTWPFIPSKFIHVM